jgi:hypothetical protein
MAYSNAGPFVLHSFWGDGAVLAGDGVGGGQGWAVHWGARGRHRGELIVDAPWQKKRK